MRDVHLVSCVAAKRAHAAPAADLYVSALFTKARAYVERSGPDARWFILSALHGLVDPRAVLDPYNVTLHGMRRAERLAWGAAVHARLRDATDPERDHLVLLAGRAYRDPLMERLLADGYRVSVPMEGLTIGRQLQWLARA